MLDAGQLHMATVKTVFSQTGQDQDFRQPIHGWN